VRRRGRQVIVLEASSRAGGLVHTDLVDGYTIEAGADSLLAQKPAALDLCVELGLREQLQPLHSRGAFVLRDSRLYALPRESLLGIPRTWPGLARYDLLSIPARVRLALEPFVPARRAHADESVASFFARRFGSATVDAIAQPLLGGIHAGDIRELSMQTLFPRLLDLEREHGSVLRGLHREGAPSSANDPSASPFVSLRGGMGTLVSALEERVGEEAIRYRCAARRLIPWRGKWRLSAGGDVIDARGVLIAAPAGVAAELLTSVDPEAARIAALVPYVSTVSVALAWRCEQISHSLHGTGFVVARGASRARITACTWVSSKWEHRAPARHVLLRAFMGGAHDPDAVNLTDDEIIASACTDLRPVLGIEGAPELTRVYRWRQAGAQHVVGQVERLAALRMRLSRHPGLFVAGSGFGSVGIPDCVADARRVARVCV
jgi:oxygen-dependent protoporphyrinogen oxidase